ncbi:ferredoxin, 2Fe-2S [Paenibacillus sp. UNCCL117]|uniref:2Fe-2S iron-sulfur cluster-binding protein n=1 Tax=unclassified Paenibacillus TaxID=185978 RepID=UPI0008806763|nr:MULTISPECIES: 2Fe-2S iron-sulfur cluster-binding protein [unclassified Paenibacillus]SDC40076.1 ferredoxin, 2Fe-2S [Paenibacillus sp. cl123]SFW13904.1 ferredoxin, 2Fe-2S [Paenibacillus sp. UNCCL117]
MKAEILFKPDGKTVQARPGTSLLDAARRAGVAIRTRCGGKAACLMCKVQVAPDAQQGLQPMNTNESLKLGSLAEEGFRLACQAKATGKAGVCVLVPEDPLKSAVRRQLERQQEEEWL